MGLVLLFFLAGCSPPGPRALLQGDRLIRDGKYAQAVEKLRAATELLPKNAQAWNHLGLAYQGAGQSSNAIVAYRKALALNRDLIVAHYNLGCLWLDQNEPAAAVEEFTSFVAHPHYAANVDGWLKLGTACLRSRRWDEAEKTYSHLLKKLGVRTPEVLNNLGVVQCQRHRPAEAISSFSSALSLQPGYAPALLNLATVYQQQPGNRSLALQKYRQYLALKPPPPNADSVEALVRQLEQESGSPVSRPAQSNLVAVASVKTNFVPLKATVAQPTPARGGPRSSTNAVSPPPVIPATRTTILASAPPKKQELPPPPANTTVVPPRRISTVETARPPETVTNKPLALEVAKVPEELLVKPVQDVSQTSPVESARPTATEPGRVSTAPSVQAGTTSAKAPKRNLLQKLNPFSGKTEKEGDSRLAATSPAPKPPARSAAVETATNPSPVAAVAGPPASLPAVPRYAYLSPQKPAAGNRSEAERFFLAGVKAQRAGRATEALAQYRRATETDPAYFDAYYNQGLAALAAGEMKLALRADEFALVLRPDSTDTRYNFALALKQAGYLLDAAEELRQLVNAHPGETRAHLALANLYAYQLSQPDLAREHYLKVLANDPPHPQAAQIRYWLATHP